MRRPCAALVTLHKATTLVLGHSPVVTLKNSSNNRDKKRDKIKELGRERWEEYTTVWSVRLGEMGRVKHTHIHTPTHREGADSGRGKPPL